MKILQNAMALRQKLKPHLHEARRWRSTEDHTFTIIQLGREIGICLQFLDFEKAFGNIPSEVV